MMTDQTARSLGLYLTFVIGVSLAGCSTSTDPGNWRHPTKPNSEWGSDFSACKSFARREINRDLGVHDGSIAQERRSGGLIGSFERTDARRREAELLDSCMARLGYRQAAS